MERDQEVALVERLRAGDTAAFDVVYDTYRARLYGYLVRLSRRSEVAEDLLEETWLRLVAHAARLDPATHLAPWLFTVARRLFMSYCRSRGIEDHALVTGAALGTLRDPSPSPHDLAVTDESVRRVEQAIARLPVSDRDVLLLVSADGLAPGEAAAACGIRADAFRQRLARARARLERELDGRR